MKVVSPDLIYESPKHTFMKKVIGVRVANVLYVAVSTVRVFSHFLQVYDGSQVDLLELFDDVILFYESI
jgi:hypothetical protein